MTSPSARLDRDTCQDSSRALSTEWLETDGIGGYASSTVLGCPTRRYHGLLIATPPGLARRHLFLSRFEERLILAPNDEVIELSVLRRAGGQFAPDGRAALAGFQTDPAPTATLRIGDVTLTREVLVPKGRAAVLCRWTLSADSPAVQLELQPCLACRELDRLQFRNDALDPRTQRDGDVLRLRPYAALPTLCLRVDAAGADWSFENEPQWTTGVEFASDLERGYEGHEDLFVPGRLRVRLAPGASLLIAASLDVPIEAPSSLRQRVLDLRQKAAVLRGSAVRGSKVRARLAARADEFLQFDPSGRLGICAGFPWFGEWGRDTFIALPGLTLARERVDQCANVLVGVLPFLRFGLVPNIFGPTVRESHYGSVDAALWFARAVDLWREAGGLAPEHDTALDAALIEIATKYHDGTALGIRADTDGLLLCGGAELNATWMDAQLDDGPVTPRFGKPIEIEALWCALLDQVAERNPKDATWRTRRDRAYRGFASAFPVSDPQVPTRGWLADRLTQGGERDTRIRPNMVLAGALRRSPLDDAMRASVLETAERELLTPRGLRTLSPRDPEYRGRYSGDVRSRDRAYHQGTVWPWLLGSYVELALRVRGPSARPALRELLDGFEDELDRNGLEHVSEVFDGDPPHHAGGTIAQAWSSAELLRAYALLEEIR